MAFCFGDICLKFEAEEFLMFQLLVSHKRLFRRL